MAPSCHHLRAPQQQAATLNTISMRAQQHAGTAARGVRERSALTGGLTFATLRKLEAPAVHLHYVASF